MQGYNASQVRLVRRYMARLDRLAVAGGSALVAVWRDVGSLDERAVAEFARQGTLIAASFAAEASALTSGYIGALIGEPVAPASVYVAPDFRGPFIRSWAALAAGVTFEDALVVGAAQADAVGQNSVISSARQAGDEVESDQIVGWRRVLDADPCDWCRMVADATFRTAQSADFGHDRCGCGVTPILRSTPDA